MTYSQQIQKRSSNKVNYENAHLQSFHQKLLHTVSPKNVLRSSHYNFNIHIVFRGTQCTWLKEIVPRIDSCITRRMHINIKLSKLVQTLKAFHVSGGVWAFFNFSHRVVPSSVVFIMSWNSLNSNVPLPSQHKQVLAAADRPTQCAASRQSCCTQWWTLSAIKWQRAKFF